LQSLWKVRQHNFQKEEILKQELKLNWVLAKILVNRGIDTPEKASFFLEAKLADLENPYKLRDMGKAVTRIKRALEQKERILVYGDYDVDGIASSSILVTELRKKGGIVQYYIPNRLTEGYGLNKEAIKNAIDQNIDLIITVDCGINSYEEVRMANNAGIDVIITDHHEPQDKLPEAVAVINPKRRDCNYPFKELAGVGVAFKLIQALSYNGKWDKELNDYLALTAIGTVADIMPLRDENRIIVKHGLKNIVTTRNLGLNTLIQQAGLGDGEINTGHVGFVIGPRLNAAGRLGNASDAIELFLTHDYERALKIVNKLENLNKERQHIESMILKGAEKLVEEINLDKETIIVLHSEEWHEGVIGIVASKITEKFNRPTILFALKEDVGKGSGRSIAAFNLFENLCKCKTLLEKFGGHELAAGLTIKPENISIFREKINREASKILKSRDLIPEIIIDAVIPFGAISYKLATDLERLKPFGPGNPKPLFLINNLPITNHAWIGADNRHLKVFSKGIEGIGFYMDKYKAQIQTPDVINTVVTIELNEWNGCIKPQLVLKDIKFPKQVYKSFREKCIEAILTENETHYQYQYCGKKLNIIDNRNCSDRFMYLRNVLCQGKKQCILINSPEEGWNLYNRLTGDLAYYNIDFYNLNKMMGIENKESATILIDPLGKEKIDGIDDLIFYDISFSETMFKKQLYSYKSANIYLIFNKTAFKENLKFLKYIFPQREFLRYVFKFLKHNKKETYNFDNVVKLLKFKTKHPINTIHTALKIFEEISIVKFINDSKFVFMPPKNKIDLNTSKTYRSIVHKLLKYEKFGRKILTEKLEKIFF